MLKIATFNNISVKGLERFNREDYEVASELGNPDALLLRSHKLAESEISDSIRAIGRAGAGTNNIPVDACTDRGIPVFNTPGANANAVKELVLTALLLSSRGIINGVSYVKTLDTNQPHDQRNTLLEKEKKQFKGQEIQGKTLGIVGLGAIGSMVADMALGLGMKVLGYDPALSVEAAWRLSSKVEKMDNLQSLLAKSDYVTLHLPLLESTRHLINSDTLEYAKPGTRLINFAREGIVDDLAVKQSLESGQVGLYIADFPTPALIGRDDVILMPHIGASTKEAEENCAVMAADQLKDFLENGNIKNSVNFPSVLLERTEGYRIGLANRNVPKMLGQVLSVLADNNLNIIDMLNKSRDAVAYNLIDIDTKPDEDTLNALRNIEGVINVYMF